MAEEICIDCINFLFACCQFAAGHCTSPSSSSEPQDGSYLLPPPTPSNPPTPEPAWLDLWYWTKAQAQIPKRHAAKLIG